jgi:phenylpropionate dioxygenase-like ring-hydroxylating dioxygenase large terminal subunit
MTWMTLPAWTYSSAEFLALEKSALFLRTWQLVGHVSEIENPGDFLKFDLLGESALIVRDHGGGLRAYHNVCRHRAMRLVDRPAGHCGALITCRYHGFSYDLGGRLVALPGAQDFEGLDRSEHGLTPLELDVHLGFIFVRFIADGGPTIGQQLARFEESLGRYLTAEMMPLAATTTTPIRANWKIAVENTLEAYHVASVHPGLERLYGRTYGFELAPWGASHGGGVLQTDTPVAWSERHYLRLLPDVAHLPIDRKRAWHYYSVFPNLAFEFYPDQVAYFQILPVEPGLCVARAASYALPDDRPEMHAARYLNARINRRVAREDIGLLEGVQAGMRSLGCSTGPLSRREARVHQFQDLIRERIPLARYSQAPAVGTAAARQRELLAAAGPAARLTAKNCFTSAAGDSMPLRASPDECTDDEQHADEHEPVDGSHRHLERQP